MCLHTEPLPESAVLHIAVISLVELETRQSHDTEYKDGVERWEDGYALSQWTSQ